MAGFSSIPKVDLTDAAVVQVRDAVLRGDLAPGEELPSEREMALQLGLNRTTVREALARLEHLGLVERRHGRRARVLDYRRSGTLALVPHLARLGVRGVGGSIREAVAISYGGTAALAARRRTRAGLRSLERAAAAVEQAVADGEPEAVVAADRDFHHTVAALTGSVTLELVVSDFYRAFDAALDTGGTLRRGIPGTLAAVVRAGRALPHRRLTEAVAAGDEAAARHYAELMATGGRLRTSSRSAPTASGPSDGRT